MDFYKIKNNLNNKTGCKEIYPDFVVGKTSDLMIRANSFYAIWDEEAGLWSTNEYDVQRLVDDDLFNYLKKLKSKGDNYYVKTMKDFSSNIWVNFKKYLKSLSDNKITLDQKIIFSNQEVKKKDYASKKLNYPLVKGKHKAWDEIINTLYNKEEKQKIEWAIGCIVSGDSKTIQKFLVLYGSPGSGKGTLINIIQMLFDGYYKVFDAKALTISNNQFSTEVFKTNPLVAIQHDGDLSKIEDNTKLNSIISHEEIIINEKNKPTYSSKLNAFLIMASNKPVKITDAQSGIIRRLIDVQPSGEKINQKRYTELMSQVEFELGEIAEHCLSVYAKLGKHYYDGYKPINMMFKTDVFFNFIEENYLVFKEEDGIPLKQAYTMYNEYCSFASVSYKLPYHSFREELKNYFKNFDDIARINNKQVRSYYSGFLENKILKNEIKEEVQVFSIDLKSRKSILDKYCSEQKAQYANEEELPMYKWSNIKTKLKDIDTKKLHYVQLQKNHIVIDFDIKDINNKKSLSLNLEEASKWPKTYAEISKGGQGIHLHYIYTGDIDKLQSVYSEGIEIKTPKGNASLRRKLTKCNNEEISEISSGLPLRSKNMVNFEAIKNEKALRTLITKGLRKEYLPGTKPSIDFIYKNLNDAYNSGINYDVTNLRPDILQFALNSTNQSEYCVEKVSNMKFKSEEISEENINYDETIPIFFDVEVYPNLFLICWKYAGNDNIVRMFNPTASEVGDLLKMKLIGFNCRRYDNHILYGAYLGYNNEQLFELSQRIINNSPNALFAEAYSLSYTDVYDFSNEKKSLKQFEVDLNISHQEINFPWDEPLDKSNWDLVASYCDNDVKATEIVFESKDTDWVARQILSKLSGKSLNDTTQNHAAAFLFEGNKKPQSEFIYTDLSKEFPGYKYSFGKSEYRGIDPSEGGYVYSKPGMYGNVALLDIVSLHPTSAIILKIFGEKYTKRFHELKEARVHVKHNDLKSLKNLLNGVIYDFINSESFNGITMDDLAYSLKIIINIVYGMTSAKYDNIFKDINNVDNIVAKRGSLFMIDLQYALEERGAKLIHIKTDSVKIADATEEIIDFIMKFGEKYGYAFEYEELYDKLCLVNKSTYIAKIKWNPKEKNIGKWTATGDQFKRPYVFKKLFSKEEITPEDLKEKRSVKSEMYLNLNENTEEDTFKFIGKVGSFYPIKDGCGGGILLRKANDKYYSVQNTKYYRWLETEVVDTLENYNVINYDFFEKEKEKAIADISIYGDIEWFTSNEPYNELTNKISSF